MTEWGFGIWGLFLSDLDGVAFGLCKVHVARGRGSEGRGRSRKGWDWDCVGLFLHGLDTERGRGVGGRGWSEKEQTGMVLYSVVSAWI